VLHFEQQLLVIKPPVMRIDPSQSFWSAQSLGIHVLEEFWVGRMHLPQIILSKGTDGDGALRIYRAKQEPLYFIVQESEHRCCIEIGLLKTLSRSPVAWSVNYFLLPIGKSDASWDKVKIEEA
jgi:hypothetical protein